MNAPPPGALLAALLTLSLAAPSRCGAQGTDARALLREGFAARRAQRDADALRAFESAWAVDGRASTLAQIGLAEHALGRWVDAERHLAACLSSDDPWVARNTAPLRASLAAVRAHLASLALDDGPAGAAVTLDGRAVATLPLHEPLRVPAGTVVLRVTAAGHHPLERSLAVAAGETLRARCGATDVAGTDAVECAPDPEARAVHARATLYRDLSIAGVGVGAAAAVAGLLWWIASPPLRPTSRGAALAWSF